MFVIKKKKMNGEDFGFLSIEFKEKNTRVSEGIYSKPRTTYQTYEEAVKVIEKAKSIYTDYYVYGYLSAKELDKNLRIERVNQFV